MTVPRRTANTSDAAEQEHNEKDQKNEAEQAHVLVSSLQNQCTQFVDLALELAEIVVHLIRRQTVAFLTTQRERRIDARPLDRVHVELLETKSVNVLYWDGLCYD